MDKKTLNGIISAATLIGAGAACYGVWRGATMLSAGIVVACAVVAVACFFAGKEKK